MLVVISIARARRGQDVLGFYFFGVLVASETGVVNKHKSD